MLAILRGSGRAGLDHMRWVLRMGMASPLFASNVRNQFEKSEDIGSEVGLDLPSRAGGDWSR